MPQHNRITCLRSGGLSSRTHAWCPPVRTAPVRRAFFSIVRFFGGAGQPFCRRRAAFVIARRAVTKQSRHTGAKMPRDGVARHGGGGTGGGRRRLAAFSLRYGE